jgi:hypothetical protein
MFFCGFTLAAVLMASIQSEREINEKEDNQPNPSTDGVAMDHE